MKEVGIVTRVRRYPVKSMAGEDLERAFVSYSGLAGDRVYALVRLGQNKHFPWFTARQRPELLRYKPHFVEAISPEDQYPELKRYEVVIVSPSGQEMLIDDPQFLAVLRNELECDFELRFSEKGMQDARPLSLISEQTIESLSTELGIFLDYVRFRANIYVRWQNENPFFEDSLLERQLQIGEKLTLFISKKDPRCKVIGLDPNTAIENPLILETVARAHDNCAGVYAVILREGIIETGARVFLL